MPLPQPPKVESSRFDDWMTRLWQLSGLGGAPYATVVQGTSKSTAVTLNASNGQITMHNAALGAGAIVSFTLTNSQIGAKDLVQTVHASGGTGGAYTLNAQSANGSAVINVRNNTAGSLSEAIVIGFSIKKAIT